MMGKCIVCGKDCEDHGLFAVRLDGGFLCVQCAAIKGKLYSRSLKTIYETNRYIEYSDKYLSRIYHPTVELAKGNILLDVENELFSLKHNELNEYCRNSVLVYDCHLISYFSADSTDKLKRSKTKHKGYYSFNLIYPPVREYAYEADTTQSDSTTTFYSDFTVDVTYSSTRSRLLEDTNSCFEKYFLRYAIENRVDDQPVREIAFDQIAEAADRLGVSGDKVGDIGYLDHLISHAFELVDNSENEGWQEYPEFSRKYWSFIADCNLLKRVFNNAKELYHPFDKYEAVPSEAMEFGYILEH